MLISKDIDPFFLGRRRFTGRPNVHHHLTTRLGKPNLSAMLHSIKRIRMLKVGYSTATLQSMEDQHAEREQSGIATLQSTEDQHAERKQSGTAALHNMEDQLAQRNTSDTRAEHGEAWHKLMAFPTGSAIPGLPGYGRNRLLSRSESPPDRCSRGQNPQQPLPLCSTRAEGI